MGPEDDSKSNSVSVVIRYLMSTFVGKRCRSVILSSRFSKTFEVHRMHRHFAAESRLQSVPKGLQCVTLD
jgi:hypothetical protein